MITFNSVSPLWVSEECGQNHSRLWNLDSCLYFMVAFQVGEVTPKYWPIGAGDFNVLTYCCLGSDTAEQ